MKVRELIKILKDDGWEIKNQRVSHIHLVHHTKKGKIQIPNHSGDIKIRTMKSILKQAGLK